MFFVFLVTTNAAKVGIEAVACTLFASFWSVGLMFLMGMLADATWPPCVHIETLSSSEPPHSNFLWTTRNEVKHLAYTL